MAVEQKQKLLRLRDEVLVFLMSSQLPCECVAISAEVRKHVCSQWIDSG